MRNELFYGFWRQAFVYKGSSIFLGNVLPSLVCGTAGHRCPPGNFTPTRIDGFDGGPGRESPIACSQADRSHLIRRLLFCHASFTNPLPGRDGLCEVVSLRTEDRGIWATTAPFSW